MRRFLMLALTGLLPACDSSSPSDPGVVCPAVAKPAVAVTALDARTAEPIRLAGVATATDGSYSDKQQNAPPGAPNYYLAYERPGTYTVSVDIPGYDVWEVSNVIIPAGVCGVSTLSLSAYLNPR